MNDWKEVIKILFECQCLSISVDKPFTYASGLRGPLYCDNRRLMSFVKERKVIVEQLASLMGNVAEEADVIAGLATAGIAPAAWLSERVSLPLAYIRSSSKSHGKRNQIEGIITPGQEVLLIEDLVNQASSLENAVAAVREVGGVVRDCFSIVNYQTKVSVERLEKLDIRLTSLVNFDQIGDYAKENKLIEKGELELLREWHNDPVEWSSKVL